ncbi:MAG: hypothetical protein Q4D38_13340 [Planctomycetia bacterium]|nr:hypothetical protein [Planctomycetia bacterium]
MSKSIMTIFVLLLPLMCGNGCNHDQMPQDDLKVVEHIKQLAIQKFDEVNGIESHQKYVIEVEESEKNWIVRFDPVGMEFRCPGDDAMVFIDKVSGEVQYLPGE